jgi:hypothetical protein
MATQRLTRKGARNAYATPASIEKRNRDTVKAIVFGDQPIRKQASAALEVDDFKEMIGSGEVIEPPFNPSVLSMMSENSSELGQIIEAMEINIEGFGGRLALRDMEDEDKVIVLKAFSFLKKNVDVDNTLLCVYLQEV